MPPTAATLARECRSFCKTLTAEPSRCLHTAKKPLLFNYPNSTSSQHRGHAHTRRRLHTTQATGSGRATKEEAQRKLKDDLRALLRDVAQPVAVVTSFMPSGNDTPFTSQTPGAAVANAAEGNAGSRYHGATLSSFTSIAMDPYPLIAFALRIPSRMATSLSSLVSPPPSSPSSPASPPCSPQSSSPSALSTAPHSHMVINLLSASQAREAITFSRPDLHPTPFASSCSSAFASTSAPTASTDGVAYILSPDGLPILRGVVGALSCRLVGPPIPLHDLSYFTGYERDRHRCSAVDMDADADVGRDVELDEGAVTSELFIAQVVRVEDVEPSVGDSGSDLHRERTLPLVYHRQAYTSCRPKHGHGHGGKT